MIKNDLQLRRATKRVREIERELEEIGRQFSGAEHERLAIPLNIEIAELREEIDVYLELTDLTLEEAVEGPLKSPLLLEQTGELLARLRLAAGLTQDELASRLGWQQANVSRFESENYHSQTIGKLVEYASALGISLHIAPSLSVEPANEVAATELAEVLPQP